ncbi:MAG: HIT family protein [Pyramidobacter sp.]|jgi:ATP adenylyltransferase
METLMAPWRYSYIQSTKSGGKSCIFCDFPGDGTDDRVHFIVYRGKSCFVILNAYPYSSGHLMVIPYRHTTDIGSFSAEEALEFHDLIARSVQCLKAAFHPDGFNVGINMGAAAGAGIDTHIHCHVVPRWNGDSNFMAAVGNTKVVPISLEETWKRCRANWH